ncbi:MAG: phosphate ABC transporter substrate-binding protein [Oscillospiraceae bacterium]|nr:phosphate ABC transporter substrate-binding protein [Oscillospiraceae bacterium]
MRMNLRKVLALVLCAALIFALGVGCSSSSNSSDTAADTTASETADAAAETTENEAVAESTEAVELSGTISTNGSTSMEKVIAALIESFTIYNPNVTITYDATGSGTGITAVTEGSTDIGLSSRNLKDAEAEAGLTATVIALDGIAIIVNTANTVTDLTIEQIAGLFTGEITNWSEVGGEDMPVAVIGREAGSGTRDGFESIVGVEDTCAYDQELTSTGAVVVAVASNEYAIGYASLSSVDDSVVSVDVEGVACTEETVLDGSYAIQRPFIMVTNDNAEQSEAVQAFLAYCTSSEVADIIANAGAVSTAQ